MAKYKGREVTVEAHIPPEYKVTVRHEDGTSSTVNLYELTLSKKEALDFLKGEHTRLEQEKVRHDKALAENEQKAKEDVQRVKEEQAKAKEQAKVQRPIEVK